MCSVFFFDPRIIVAVHGLKDELDSCAAFLFSSAQHR